MMPAERSVSYPVALLTEGEVESVWRQAGFNQIPPEASKAVVELTRARVDQRLALLNEPIDNVIRFGAFSYLLESIRNLGSEGPAIEASIAVPLKFLNENAELARNLDNEMDKAVFARFAELMVQGGSDWESFCIAFLDPEAAFVERIRQNLLLTPTERWRRHENFRRQINKARRVG